MINRVFDMLAGRTRKDIVEFEKKFADAEKAVEAKLNGKGKEARDLADALLEGLRQEAAKKHG